MMCNRGAGCVVHTVQYLWPSKSGTQYATAELFFRFIIQVQRPGNNGVSGRQATPEAGLEQPGFWHTVFRPHVRGAKILVVIAV